MQRTKHSFIKNAKERLPIPGFCVQMREVRVLSSDLTSSPPVPRLCSNILQLVKVGLCLFLSFNKPLQEIPFAQDFARIKMLKENLQGKNLFQLRHVFLIDNISLLLRYSNFPCLIRLTTAEEENNIIQFCGHKPTNQVSFLIKQLQHRINLMDSRPLSLIVQGYCICSLASV